MDREPSIRGSAINSVSDLTEGGRAWLAAEFLLIQAQLEAEGKRLGWICGLAALAIITVTLGLTLLLVYAVAMLAPIVGGVANAAGILGLSFLLVSVLSLLIVLGQFKKRVGVRAIYRRWTRLFNQEFRRSA